MPLAKLNTNVSFPNRTFDLLDCFLRDQRLSKIVRNRQLHLQPPRSMTSPVDLHSCRVWTFSALNFGKLSLCGETGLLLNSQNVQDRIVSPLNLMRKAKFQIIVTKWAVGIITFTALAGRETGFDDVNLGAMLELGNVTCSFSELFTNEKISSRAVGTLAFLATQIMDAAEAEGSKVTLAFVVVQCSFDIAN